VRVRPPGSVLYGVLATLPPAPLHAHPGAWLQPGEVWRAWSFEPAVVLLLVGALLLYARGIQRVWRRAGFDRGVRHWQAWCFAAGMLMLIVALVSPLNALGGALFSAHMTQHVVLMALAAPLLVLGAPLTALTWALPRRGRRAVSAALNGARTRQLWHGLSLPLVAWLLHAAAVWLWHVPALYTATLDSELVHTLQHASFMGTAVLFWWALRDRTTHGLGVLYLFTTAVHGSLLGALLTFSPTVLYAPYEATAPLWGLSALEDQQLGGLIMWVPAGLIYFGAALALLASWLRTAQQRVQRAGAVGAAQRA
jgi:putative membrane protein